MIAILIYSLLLHPLEYFQFFQFPGCFSSSLIVFFIASGFPAQDMDIGHPIEALPKCPKYIKDTNERQTRRDDDSPDGAVEPTSLLASSREEKEGWYVFPK
jgi:hypothetical protein